MFTLLNSFKYFFTKITGMNFHIINFLIIFKSFSVAYETRRVDDVDALLSNIYFWFNRLHVKNDRGKREERL